MQFAEQLIFVKPNTSKDSIMKDIKNIQKIKILYRLMKKDNIV